MKSQVLINNTKKYSGNYVATRSFADKDVLVAGKDPMKVFKKSKGLGVEEPVIVYIPRKDEVLIY
ncbi:MAG: hypothetical protein JRC53_02335 [Deltaproteobacteria bacterium]|nr:hypothetical protein [Deltaproteobacteria bacterium]